MTYKRLLIADVVLGGALLGLAAIVGNHQHGWKNVVGGIGWFGFLLCALILILLVLYGLAQTLLRRRATA